MNTLYRIYTEDKDRPLVATIIAGCFGNFTILSATGYWRGVSEPSLVIEIITADSEHANVRAVAEAIKHANRQECVLVTSAPVSTDFVV